MSWRRGKCGYLFDFGQADEIPRTPAYRTLGPSSLGKGPYKPFADSRMSSALLSHEPVTDQLVPLCQQLHVVDEMLFPRYSAARAQLSRAVACTGSSSRQSHGREG